MLEYAELLSVLFFAVAFLVITVGLFISLDPLTPQSVCNRNLRGTLRATLVVLLLACLCATLSLVHYISVSTSTPISLTGRLFVVVLGLAASFYMALSIARSRRDFR